MVIGDIKDSDPLFNQIQTVVGLDIMKLNRDGKFLPDSPVSGGELFQIISKATTQVQSSMVHGSRLD